MKSCNNFLVGALIKVKNVTHTYIKEVVMKLTPFHESELKFLRRRVDNLQEERYRKDPHPNIERDLWYAREELETFVSSLRQDGYNI